MRSAAGRSADDRDRMSQSLLMPRYTVVDVIVVPLISHVDMHDLPFDDFMSVRTGLGPLGADVFQVTFSPPGNDAMASRCAT